MAKQAALSYAIREADRLFPIEPEPDPIVPDPLPAVEVEPEASGVLGLADIPASWPTLPSNASLSSEVSWVQANRLRVVDGDQVDLSRALSPAPSYAALGWLETSIRAYVKWCDIAAKATSSATDEGEQVRRERMAISDMRALLAEMTPTCPHCGKGLA